MMQKKMKKQHQAEDDDTSSKGVRWEFQKIMEEVEFLGASQSTWKERKELENRKVVKLGGKPPKKQRLPLSVARVQMKKQKEREEKMLQESLIFGRFGGKRGGGTRSTSEKEKRKPEDRVLKSIEGHFRNGVLDVKHMLKSGSGSSRERDFSTPSFNDGMMQSGKKKGGGGKKKKGGGKKRR